MGKRNGLIYPNKLGATAILDACIAQCFQSSLECPRWTGSGPKIYLMCSVRTIIFSWFAVLVIATVTQSQSVVDLLQLTFPPQAPSIARQFTNFQVPRTTNTSVSRVFSHQAFQVCSLTSSSWALSLTFMQVSIDRPCS